MLRHPVQEAPQLSPVPGHQLRDRGRDPSRPHAPQALKQTVGLGRQLEPGQPAVVQVGHPAQVPLLLEAVDKRYQRAWCHVQAAGELPARLGTPASNHHERAKLRHRQLHVHEKPHGLIGKRELLPSPCPHDRPQLRIFHKWFESIKSLDLSQ